jgi:chromosome segregation ATPase
MKRMAKAQVVGLLCLGLLLEASAAAGKSKSLLRIGAAGQARENALEAAWQEELDPVKYKSPIKRVVALLQKMKAELDAEADKESEMYDKMVCWCQTNEKEKKKAIADAEAKDVELSSEIEARAAKFGEAATEIARLKKQIAEDTAALKEATALREKQAGEFSTTEKELMQSITNVKNAIEVLSKHHSGASFAQIDAPVMSSMRAVLRDLAFKHEMLVAGRHEKGLSFLQQDSSSTGDSLLSALDAAGASMVPLPIDAAQKILEHSAHDGTATGAGFLQAGVAPTSGSYAPQSGQIFGILKQLKEDFEINLSQSQKEEITAVEDFKGLSAAKTAQITSGKEKLDMTEGDHADNQKALSDAKEDLELTREQRSKDVEFLQNLKTTCMDLDKQWEQRSKTRAAETKAVSEAIAIITEDDNMDLLRQSVTLLQVDSSAEMRVRRNRVVTSLRKAAQDPFFATEDLMDAWHSRSGQILSASGSPRTQLSTLAVTASLDSFTKIKQAMDKMVADLKEEQASEVKLKAHCDKEFDATDKEKFRKNEEAEDLQNTIEKLAKLITKLTEEIEAAKAQVADTEVAIKKASQVRESENAEFQVTVADQRATQTILTKALGKLKEFYKKAFLQKSKQEPPVKFNSYKTNAGASPVIGMIEQIIEDSKALESEAVAGETEAQQSYETFVKDSNDLIADLNASVSEKTKQRSTAKTNSETAKSDLESTNGELEALTKYEADLHSDCDFVLKNFEIRQKARMDEMEAIQQAKAILSGMK